MVLMAMGPIAFAQTSPADNRPFATITFKPIPKASSVYGVFQGRTPCPIASQLHMPTSGDCEKLKWQIVLYREPATFVLTIVGGGEVVHQQGGSYRWYEVKGQWTVLKGIALNTGMDVFRLTIDDKGTELRLLKGDDNVLFLLDKDFSVLAGDGDFSYTLNRVELFAGKK